MLWKRWANKVRNPILALLILAAAACGLIVLIPAHALTDASTNAPATPTNSATPYRKFKVVDADNHSIVLNRPGVVTLVLGTSEDSQDAARAAGRAVCPLQGRPDFQLMVVVDLRNSLATWVPSVVLEQMRSNLDREAIELKPFYLKNGNKSNPRTSSHVIADFSGTICPQLGWNESSENLRGILYGVDGREIMRWDKIDDDMVKLQSDIRGVIQTLIDEDKAKAAMAIKNQGTKIVQPSLQHPPLLPPAPPAAKDD
jgi:hypothetical protein